MLLDTHALLWFLNNSPELKPELKQKIEREETIFLSIVSLWEIAIKLGLKKLTLDIDFAEIPEILEKLDIETLPITFADITAYRDLPLHHRDPFNRMLIAQARSNSLVLVSRDKAFDAYPVERLWE